jgi:hypothetical protein
MEGAGGKEKGDEDGRRMGRGSSQKDRVDKQGMKGGMWDHTLRDRKGDRRAMGGGEGRGGGRGRNEGVERDRGECEGSGKRGELD